MKKTFQVEGMMCGHCEARVNKAVSALSGVSECKASAADGSVMVNFDETAVSQQDIVNTIEDTGYDVK